MNPFNLTRCAPPHRRTAEHAEQRLIKTANSWISLQHQPHPQPAQETGLYPG